MDDFIFLIEQLDSSTSTNSKINSLVSFFKKAHESDTLWAIYLLSGNKIKKHFTSTQFRTWTTDYLQIPEWMYRECSSIVGDRSETIALLFDMHSYGKSKEEKKEGKSIQYWADFFENMKDFSEEKKKESIIEVLCSFDTKGRFVFNKLLSGAFRVGVSKQTVIQALAKFTNQEATAIANRLHTKWHPRVSTFTELILTDSKKDTISKPYPFALAYSYENKDDSIDDFHFEWKLDGIRAQLISREDKVFLWSRGGEEIAHSFPELTQLKVPNGVVLDGEIIVYKGGIRSFNDLQNRLGRKRIPSNLLKTYPVLFVAYDILEIDGEDIREKTIEERRDALDSLQFNTLPLQGDELDTNIVTSPLLSFRSWKEAKEAKDNSRACKAEGFMLKRKKSTYPIGRKKGYWYKLKVDPFSIDAVLLYAKRGTGRRANLYSDFTFAVWKDENELVPIAKAYSGLTDSELSEITNWVKANSIESFGPVRSVTPTRVFEIAFEGIRESNRHKSGISLRFPRILRERKDKPPHEADTLKSVRAILKEYES